MKKITSIALLILAFITIDGLAQEKKPASPKETVEAKIDDVKITIVYSRPSARGRKIMGELVPFGQVWRTGANEATAITFNKAVTIEGQKVEAGTYALFTIPNENDWVIILNKDYKEMGAYNYKEKNDVIRVTVKPSKSDFTEIFTISGEKNSINLKWENTSVSFSVKKG